MWLVLNPLGESLHPRVTPQRLHGVVAPLKVRVRERGVYVTVAGATQGDRATGITPLEFLSTLLPALHLFGVRSRQEMVARQGAFLEVPAA